MEADPCPQPSPHFAHNEINALPLNGQHAVTAITALWLWLSTAFRWLQQPIGRHLMSNVVEQVIQRHPEVKNEGIPESDTSYRRQGPTQKRKAEQEATRIQSATAITLFFRVFKRSEYTSLTVRRLPLPADPIGFTMFRMKVMRSGRVPPVRRGLGFPQPGVSSPGFD